MKPCGLVRLIDENAYIYEGIINQDGKRDGFAIKFSPYGGIIYIGWYKGGHIHGDFMEI